jgi:glycosyltransferase involved in cell wall biosynthesis
VRIAMVHPTLDVGGGAERLVAWLTAGLTARGHELAVFTDRYDPARFAPPGLPEAVRVVGPGPLGRLIDSKLLREQSIGRRLGRRLGGFDLVAVHNTPAQRWLAAAGDLPPVLWYCNEPSRILHAAITDPEILALADGDGPGNEQLRAEARELRRRTTKSKADLHRKRDVASVERVTRLTGNSEFIAKRIEAVYGRPCSVCWPGVPAPVGPAPGREDFVLAVGPIVPRKNVHNVVAAILQLMDARRVRRLVVTGRPDDVLRARVEDHDAGERVSFVERASDAELDRLYRTCALVAHVPVAEPFGLVAVEAMARGTAIVGPALGGPTETIVDGETGLLADPFRPEDIAAKIDTLLGDADRRLAMGEAGRRRYEAEFTLEAFVGRFEAECRATLEAGKR